MFLSNKLYFWNNVYSYNVFDSYSFSIFFKLTVAVQNEIYCTYKLEKVIFININVILCTFYAKLCTNFWKYGFPMLFNFVLVWLYNYFDLSVTYESCVDETRVWRIKF